MEVQSMDSGPVQHRISAAGVDTRLSRQEPLPQGSAGTKAIEKAGQLQQSNESWSQEELERGIEAMNGLSAFKERSLAFEQHEKLNRTMVKIIDRETEEVIREIPPEKFLDMISSMLEFAGIIIDEKA